MQISFLMFALALLTAEFLWPTEDAVNGGGLHLAVLWLVLGSVHSVRLLLAGNDADAKSRQAPFTAIDFAVLLIATGHIVSTAGVFHVNGDCRAAVNLTLEWLAIFSAWRLFRTLGQDRLLSNQFLQVFLAIAVGLSVYGIWQHHVFYAEQAEWYRGLRGQLDQAIAQHNGTGAIRASEIQSELQARGIPTGGTDRMLWENRLLSSSEPFATFSLANTLAGVLAVAFVLMAGQFAGAWKSSGMRSWKKNIFAVLPMLMIGYCLLLTKSRSAWAGAAVGLLLVVVIHSRAASARRIFIWGTCIVTAGVALVLAAIATGTLDKQVILESPRSLQFRLLYWQGTLEMLKAHPLTGAGPGNFRQAYLPFKADESSEEIRDPHNFVLEAWAASGLIGLCGLLLLVAIVLRRLAASFSVVDEIAAPAKKRPLTSPVVVSGLASGFAIHLASQWFEGASLSDQTPGLLCLVSGAAITFFRTRESDFFPDKATCLAAAVALMVHLLAAGGFSMPAVALLLLLCIALGVTESPKVVNNVAINLTQRLSLTASAALKLILAAAAFLFGVKPVFETNRFLTMADDLMHQQRNPRAALLACRQAAESDGLAPVPRQRIAELQTYRLKERQISEDSPEDPADASRNDVSNTSLSATSQLAESLEDCELLISVDRRSSFAHRLKAECLALGGEMLDKEELVHESIVTQQQVVSMYPSSVEDWVRLVRLCRMASEERWGQVASKAAQRALRLEQINRAWGHQDRYLAEADVRLLKSVAVSVDP
jgi:hypothetical protein